MTLLRRLAAVALLATASSAPALADIVVFQETFGAPQGDACSPSFPAGWTRIDVDQRTPDPDAEFVGPAWETRHDPFDLDGNCSAVSTSWYDPVGASNDWMITPLIHVPEGSVLTWRSLTEDPGYPESYQVRYSFTTPTIPAFEVNPVLFTSLFEESGTWTRHTVDLGAKGLTGRAVYFAFRNISNDQYFLHVDDVEITFEDAIFDAEFGTAVAGVCSPSFPAGWIRLDLDLGVPLEPWVEHAWEAHDTFPDDLADCAAFSMSAYTVPGTADDWMITPPIAIPYDAELRWEASAFTDSAEFADGYEVRWISDVGEPVEPADFLAHEALFLTAAENLSWTARSIDLDAAGLGGQTVRFAFWNHSTDKYLLAIDSVEVALPILFRDGFESGFAGAWSVAVP